ncbi:unnamed protein product, partial [marine sediment metagenome]
MTEVVKIGWGGYADYEGPYFWGKQKYVYAESARCVGDKVTAVVTATEGGTYDAYNGYDVCRSTPGLIQFCDKVYNASRMLGWAISEGCITEEFVTMHANMHMDGDTGVSFRLRGHPKEARYCIFGEPVITDAMQQAVFFLGASGHKGSFSAHQREHAKNWARGQVGLWGSRSMQFAQRMYVSKQIMGARYITRALKPVIQRWLASDNPYEQAAAAVYTSYAANSPRRASQALRTVFPSGTDF